MTLDDAIRDGLAAHLECCQLEARDTPKITDEHPGLDRDDACAVDDRIVARKVARSARVVGLRCDLTSHAKMKQMGVDTPVFGFLVDEFGVAEGAEVDTEALIHPEVEPRICFGAAAPATGRRRRLRPRRR